MMFNKVSITCLALLVVCVSASWFDTCSPSGKRMVTRGIIGDCWDTWSRCTRWSYGGTGTVWETCDECCKIKGHSGGSCQEKPSKCPLSSHAWQCVCN